MVDRRTFLTTSVAGLAFLGLQRAGLAASLEPLAGTPPFASLAPDPARHFDLAGGFSYRIIARSGQTMTDGWRLPGDPDGMAAFAGRHGRVILVCNHELDLDEFAAGPFADHPVLVENLGAKTLFDRGYEHPCPGGTTTHQYNPEDGRIERSFLSLAGTERNCAGGPTPWGSWLSCEETRVRAGTRYRRDHGWVFEVPATAETLVEPVALTAMGRFNHEACAVDPATGIVYMTEDQSDGLFYRYIPERQGHLAAGGRLQALTFRDPGSADTRNWSQPALVEHRSQIVDWIGLDDVESPDDDLRHRGHAAGAALFARGEGLWSGNGEVYLAATTGGPDRLGQIFRLIPGIGGDRLELFYESRHPRLMKHCDNLTVTPWGDLLVCEDRDDSASLLGVTPSGRVYEFARNVGSESELAGVCFAPDGRTLFVNLQDDGLMLAITGPFPSA